MMKNYPNNEFKLSFKNTIISLISTQQNIKDLSN